jgi:hypothetical protein
MIARKKEGETMSYCLNCGKEVDEKNSSFCGHCGTKITGSPAAHPSSTSKAPVDVKSESAEEAQKNSDPSTMQEKKRTKTIMTTAILGGIVIALIIIALIIFKSDISNKTAMTGTQGFDQGMNSEEQSQVNSQNGYPESSENAGSMEPRYLQRGGIVADGRPFIETDKDVYYYGEQIRVHYYNAPGYARDWICIVPAGSRNTAVGNFHYIPRGGRGVMIFKSSRPGKYEARAFYSYSPSRYTISARYGFTVEDRPANY